MTPHDKLAAGFVQFAEADGSHEPLYRELSRHIAGDEAILALLDAAPPTQRRPVLLFAAVHYLLLRGIAHPLARYYPSLGGQAEAGAGAFAAFQDFCRAQSAALRELLASRTTQTNEVGRCAVLLPILQQLAVPRGKPITLIDAGCSAGLNLGIDRYRYRYPGCAVGDPASPVVMTPRATGHAPVPAKPFMPDIRVKLGVDIAPVDIMDDDQVLWLRACLWPHDTARMQRFIAAADLMRRQPVALTRGDVIEFAQQHTARHAQEATVVLFHSWVATYFDSALRARFTSAFEALVRGHGAVWIAAEAPGVIAGAPQPPLAPDASEEMRSATLWSVCSRNGNGDIAYRTVARSHPHGDWIEWLGQGQEI